MCRLCGSIMDTKGIHCLSCTVGGDAIARHNDNRDLIHKFAGRGRFNPVLEKAGLLQEPVVFLQLRRPADVLVDAPTGFDSNALVKIALDVKVINALGPDHIQDTMISPTMCLEAYREHALQHNRIADRCKTHGVVYEPIVFSCQGGLERHTEVMINRLAAGIARVEGIPCATANADTLEDISICLARHAVRAIAKRMPLNVQRGNSTLWRCVDEAACAATTTMSVLDE